MIAAEYAGITFTAKELDRKVTPEESCERCVFCDSKSHECVEANNIAEEAGLVNCDLPGPKKGQVIYVRTTKGDPRQLDCAGAVHTSEAS